jgi:hypothetical protein
MAGIEGAVIITAGAITIATESVARRRFRRPIAPAKAT